MVDSAKCIQEWSGFRRMMADGVEDESFQDTTTFLQHFFINGWDEVYPNLTDLLILAVVLPVGSCSVERCFSAMKRIKTRLRNRLTNRNLEFLMLASVEGPDWENKDVTELSDEQADQIVTLFGALAERRLPF